MPRESLPFRAAWRASICLAISIALLAPSAMHAADRLDDEWPRSGRVYFTASDYDQAEWYANQICRASWLWMPAGSDSALDEIELKAAAGDNLEERVSSAQRLAYNGRPQRAIPILDDVASRQPRGTGLMVGLSMGYEIAGANEQALRWLAEALARQPTLNGNTEWLHVKILKAKLAAAGDPAWFDTHSIAGLDFGSADKPAQAPGAATDADGHFKTRAETRAALETQIPLQQGWVRAVPGGAVYCNLLLDLGNLLALDGQLWLAERIYWRAYLCNSALSELAKRRCDWAHSLNRRQPQPNRFAQAAWLGTSVIAAIAVLYVLWRLARRPPATAPRPV